LNFILDLVQTRRTILSVSCDINSISSLHLKTAETYTGLISCRFDTEYYLNYFLHTAILIMVLARVENAPVHKLFDMAGKVVAVTGQSLESRESLSQC
jgi:hypothetical protein